jgi:hypothetical protein
MILKRLRFEIKFWFENLFKYKHGYAKNCTGKKSKKCPVCNTPWPIIKKTPTRKYLESIDYYNNYRTIYFPSNENDGLSHVGGIYKGGYLEFPKGMNDQELIEITKKLKPEYDILTKGTGEKELKKRGALEGHNEEDINKS